jgi:hypothetical protein
MSKRWRNVEPITGIVYYGKRGLKLKLLAIDPHCHWCGKEVKDYATPRRIGEPYRKDEATIDHLISRFHRKKGETVGKVLACGPCNTRRSTLEMIIFHRPGIDRRASDVSQQ